MAKKSNPGTGARSPMDEPSATWLSPGRVAMIFFGLSILNFLPAFLPGHHIFGTDYAAGGYFFYDFVSQRLAAFEMPGWVPHIYGGLPLSANPGSTFHPVRLLADLILPTTWILPFIFVVHFGLAGLGMYLLVRELGCRGWVSFVAGLAFQFTGTTMSAVYAGHDGRIIVATLAPMFFFFLHRGIRVGSVGPFVGAAVTLGMGLLSFQIQSNYYLLLGGFVWALFSIVHLGFHKLPSALARRVGLGLGAVAFGFLIASVNFLPFIDYLPESPRGGEGGRGYDYSTSWSMPPAELISIAVPEQPGILEHYAGENPFKLHTEYVGSFVLVMLLLGFRFARRNRYWLFFGGLSLIVLSVSFGGHTPIYRLYYELLPGTTRFRAPNISFFLFAVSLVVMAALTLEAMVRAREEADRGRRSAKTSSGEGGFGLGIWLAGAVGAAVLALVLAAASAGDAPRDAAMVTGFGRFALFTGLVCGAVWLWWSDRLRTTPFIAAISLLVVLDLWIIDRKFFETWPPPEVTFARDDVVSFLEAQPGENRVWVLPVPPGGAYRGHGNYLMLFGIDQAGGEHGNQLQRYNEFVGAGEEVYVDWSNFLESPNNFLRAASVRFVVSMIELNTPLFREVHRGSALVYEHAAPLPRAYLVEDVVATADSTGALEMLSSPDFDVARSAVVYGDVPATLSGQPLEGTVTIAEYSPDRIAINATASRPALLVLADNYYRGWRAMVNGVEAPILRTNHAFRGVVVGAGESEVVFEYHPRDLYLGFYIYLACLVLLAGYGGWLLLRLTRPRNVGPVEG